MWATWTGYDLLVALTEFGLLLGIALLIGAWWARRRARRPWRPGP